MNERDVVRHLARIAGGVRAAGIRLDFHIGDFVTAEPRGAVGEQGAVSTVNFVRIKHIARDQRNPRAALPLAL